MSAALDGETYTPISADMPEFQALLRAAGLPREDLAGAGKRYWGRFEDGSGLVAAGGLEACGNNGILRSCVVREGLREDRRGAALVSFLIEEAHANGLETLYLLTETAAAWFARFGFVEVARASVPEEVARAPQFAGICPDSAVAMKRSDGDLAGGRDPERS